MKDVVAVRPEGGKEVQPDLIGMRGGGDLLERLY